MESAQGSGRRPRRAQRKQPQKQRKDDVLLHRAGEAAKDQQIERKLRNAGQKQQPPRIGADIPRVREALREQKAIQRKRQPPDAAKCACGREKRQPGVIDAHTDQRNQAQNKRGQSVSPPFGRMEYGMRRREAGRARPAAFTASFGRNYDTTSFKTLSMFGIMAERKRKSGLTSPKKTEITLQTRTFNDIMRMLF